MRRWCHPTCPDPFNCKVDVGVLRIWLRGVKVSVMAHCFCVSVSPRAVGSFFLLLLCYLGIWDQSWNKPVQFTRRYVTQVSTRQTLSVEVRVW